jgi:hypothetical protein
MQPAAGISEGRGKLNGSWYCQVDFDDTTVLSTPGGANMFND